MSRSEKEKLHRESSGEAAVPIPTNREENATAAVSTRGDDEVDLPRRVIPKINNYIELCVHRYDNELFRSHFRLKRRYTYQFIDRFQRTDFLRNNEPMVRAITHERAFLLILMYLANTETFREISDRFDITMSSAHRVLRVTLNFYNFTYS
ncbi:hypothetical protein HCN44_010950 [Aphidius gifuensis]|uniref:Nuclease HARBI1 n=1 Tax=Aphidius gifuensis TaxID=684658 RepID=A0A834Y8B7_APHGI|nr:hypothetical protein HCN44_010950 [Aphidius gifuensis]